VSVFEELTVGLTIYWAKDIRPKKHKKMLRNNIFFMGCKEIIGE